MWIPSVWGFSARETQELPSLSLNKINKQIKDKIILKDISFTLEEGEILGLLGPNGAGKTSMMKIISGLSRVNSGKLEILGIDADKERAKIKSQLGFVMQDNNMEREFSVKEALLYYARLYKVKNYKYEVEKIYHKYDNRGRGYRKCHAG